jgi:hypothetical protein
MQEKYEFRENILVVLGNRLGGKDNVVIFEDLCIFALYGFLLQE